MLEPDMIDPREPSKGGIRWMVSCDADECKEHVHVGVPRQGSDPRLAAGLSGWTLDELGMDFCPEHREVGKALRDMPLFPYEE